MEYNVQGTSHPGMYIEFQEGLNLCNEYGLDQLKDLLQRAKESLTLQGNHQLPRSDA